MEAEPVTEIVRCCATDGTADELAAALKISITQFAHQPGCLTAKAYRGVESEEPNTFYLIIEWDSIDAHLAWRDSESAHRMWFLEHVRPLISGPNLIGHFRQTVESRFGHTAIRAELDDRRRACG